MSKFDAKLLTQEQRLDCAQAYLLKYAHFDKRGISSDLQSRLDAARVPEPTASELEREFANMMIRDGVFVKRTDIIIHLSAIEDARKREAGQ